MEQKQNISESLALDEKRLGEINRLTKKALTADEVYAFRVVLCDNEVDRDFEKFTLESLEKLGELFVGKTGIFDHTPKAENQIARIYRTEVQECGETTSQNEPYSRLLAEAYIPKTPKNEEFIQSIEAGIHKEVSVGCATAKRLCSICGADVTKEFCEHKKGQSYEVNGTQKQCHHLLCEPYDAYEWSFVAVPAQRRAGVTKAYLNNRREEKSLETDKLLKTLGEGEITLTKSQAEGLRQELARLKSLENAQCDELRQHCTRQTVKHFPHAEPESVAKLFEGLDIGKLKSICELFKSEPEEVQLSPNLTHEPARLGEFII